MRQAEMDMDSRSEPARLTVPTCIGCGAMGRPGSCELGCREHKLVLVRAAAHDSLAVVEERAKRSIELLRSVCQEALADEPGPQQSCTRIRELARNTLRSELATPGSEVDAREPSEAATAWRCPECGGIDAPQPCLGICLWRPVEWVAAERYESERARVLRAVATADRLRSLTRRLAHVTPRAGAEEQTRRAFQAEAERTLA